MFNELFQEIPILTTDMKIVSSWVGDTSIQATWVPAQRCYVLVLPDDEKEDDRVNV